MASDVNPKISVIMSVYNSSAFLAEAIESVLNQTFSDFEFIIINDGSSDNSSAIISSFKDSRINLISNEGNKGLIYSLNKGISAAKGQFIARMDADDACDKSRFEKQLNEFKKDTDLVICGSFIKTFGNGKEELIDYYPVTHAQIISSVFFTCPFAHPSVMIRKSALDKLSEIYREEYKHSEDYDLWSRLVFTGKAKNIPEFLLNYRVHPGQVSTVHEELKYTNVKKIQRNVASQFNLEVTSAESDILLNLFKGISRRDNNYLKETSALIVKLFDSFGVKYPMYIETHARILVSRWFKVCGNSGLGFTNVKNAFSLPFFKVKYLKFKDLIKLLYKSITNYQQTEKQNA